MCSRLLNSRAHWRSPSTWCKTYRISKSFEFIGSGNRLRIIRCVSELRSAFFFFVPKLIGKAPTRDGLRLRDLRVQRKKKNCNSVGRTMTFSLRYNYEMLLRFWIIGLIAGREQRFHLLILAVTNSRGCDLTCFVLEERTAGFYCAPHTPLLQNGSCMR